MAAGSETSGEAHFQEARDEIASVVTTLVNSDKLTGQSYGSVVLLHSM